MAGPCSVESEEQIVTTALFVKKCGASMLRGGAFKPRTSPYSFQGLGVPGLEILARVREAYRFADEAHLGQFRASGEPYITHPIAVAGLCAEWKLDVQAIMAALMHDTIEDQGVTKTELIEKFGAPTADLVVMNPTHYAVAIQYDDATMAAPRVIASRLSTRIRPPVRLGRSIFWSWVGHV